MNRYFSMKRIFLLIIICAVATGGCGNPYPEFYTLSPSGPIPKNRGTGIGVGPVILAEYVDRQNLVVQTSPNKIEVAENHLWAGTLDDSIERVLSINIGRRLGTGNVRTYPWLRDSEIDFQVTMDIHEFMAGADGYAHLEATWRVYSLPGRRLVASRNHTGSEPIPEENFEAMVAAQSKLLEGLSEDIAKGIRGR